jgi:hypothetical protein
VFLHGGILFLLLESVGNTWGRGQGQGESGD